MTGSHDDAPAARGPPLGTRALSSEVRESSCTCHGVLFYMAVCTSMNVTCLKILFITNSKRREIGVGYPWN